MSALNTLLKALMSVVLVSLCAYGLIAGTSLWMFAKPSIKVRQVISITAPQANQNNYEQVILMSGWAYPESWGAWSIADKATLSLPKPESNSKSLVLETRALVSNQHPEQLVKVFINSQMRTSALLSKEDGNQIMIPLEAVDFSGERLLIDLQLPNLVSPAALGIGQDERKLALGLKSVRYQ
jgi:hypothetical protein